MRVLYIYRHPQMGHSIGKVFRSIECEMRKYADVDSFYMSHYGYGLRALIRNIIGVLRHVRKNNYDLIHITGTEHYLLPFLNRYKTIVTVHDLGFLTYYRKKIAHSFLKKLLFVYSLKYSKKIVCISHKTKQEVAFYIPSRINDMIVINNPVSEMFSFSEKKFDDKCPRILHIGTLAHKNLDNTILALRTFVCKLVIIGKLNNNQLGLLQDNEIAFENKWNLPDEEILKEYEKCDIVNFPSLYEGFGMPIIEGQTVGRIVVTSNMSPMNEVAGEGAVIVDPYSVESIRMGYVCILNSKTERDMLVLKGRKNAENYNVKSVGSQYRVLYASLLK